MNCAPTAAESFVWFHFHPAGSVYIPFAGRVCFTTGTKDCVSPGEARWTSPNLYYFETFDKLHARASAASR
jgi:hypothetical protein